MTSAPDRTEIAAAVVAAAQAGARPSAACAEIGLSPRTVGLLKKPSLPDSIRGERSSEGSADARFEGAQTA